MGEPLLFVAISKSPMIRVIEILVVQKADLLSATCPWINNLQIAHSASKDAGRSMAREMMATIV